MLLLNGELRGKRAFVSQNFNVKTSQCAMVNKWKIWFGSGSVVWYYEEKSIYLIKQLFIHEN